MVKYRFGSESERYGDKFDESALILIICRNFNFFLKYFNFNHFKKQLKLNATTQTELRVINGTGNNPTINNNISHKLYINPFNEFENLNADEIIERLKIDENKNKNKSSTLTPSSSSFSISVSSSNQSITSSATQSTIQNAGRKLRDSNGARLSSQDFDINIEYSSLSRNL